MEEIQKRVSWTAEKRYNDTLTGYAKEAKAIMVEINALAQKRRKKENRVQNLSSRKGLFRNLKLALLNLTLNKNDKRISEQTKMLHEVWYKADGIMGDYMKKVKLSPEPYTAEDRKKMDACIKKYYYRNSKYFIDKLLRPAVLYDTRVNVWLNKEDRLTIYENTGGRIAFSLNKEEISFDDACNLLSTPSAFNSLMRESIKTKGVPNLVNVNTAQADVEGEVGIDARERVCEDLRVEEENPQKDNHKDKKARFKKAGFDKSIEDAKRQIEKANDEKTNPQRREDGEWVR